MVDVKEHEAQHQDYFKQVVKEALKMLDKGKSAYVFYQEQVDYIKSLNKYKEINVQLNEGIYYLSISK